MLFSVLCNLALKQVMIDMQDNKNMEFVGNNTPLSFDKDIVILGKSKDEIKIRSLKLIKAFQINN